jgi:hypothetical protein
VEVIGEAVGQSPSPFPRIPDIYPEKGENFMEGLDRITVNPAVMAGKPCIRGMRVR